MNLAGTRGTSRVLRCLLQVESDCFVTVYMQTLKSIGQCVSIDIIPEVDHFDLIERLTEPHYLLTQAS